MATLAECEAALHDLSRLLAQVDADVRNRHVPDRVVACEVSDLGVVFRGRLSDAGLTEIELGRADGAQVKLKTSSDDLVALACGELNLGVAWATGRLKVDASLGDMLRLRSLL